MPKSIFHLKSRRVVYHAFEPGESPADLHAFLSKLHQSLNEPLEATLEEDRLEVNLERAPKAWELLNKLRSGELRPSYDGEYIRFNKPTPAN